MNERIKELAKQSGISILYEYDGYDGHAAVCNLEDIEKFTELLLLEVLSLQNRHGNIKPKKVREHFGVQDHDVVQSNYNRMLDTWDIE